MDAARGATGEIASLAELPQREDPPRSSAVDSRRFRGSFDAAMLVLVETSAQPQTVRGFRPRFPWTMFGNGSDGLGHDDRAKEAQPAASRLGPRFLPWQLDQSVEESWEEPERHADRLEALLGRLFAADAGSEDAPPRDASKPTDLFGKLED